VLHHSMICNVSYNRW